MLFKLCYTVNRLDIHSKEVFSLDIDSNESIRFVLRAATDEERERGQKSYNALLEILGKFEPTRKSLPVFTAIIEGRRLLEGQKAKSAEEMIIRDGSSYGLEHYPDPFVSFVDKVSARLSSAGYALVSVIRWRHAQEGPPSPIGSKGFFCSNDGGDSWHPIPRRYSIQNVTPPHSVFIIEETDVDEIRELVTTDQKEPVYHELFREAKELQHSSPRSSIFIAMSAAEVAVKSTIANNVPESKWLVENIQSPPLVKILVEYLPNLFSQVDLLYETNKKSRFIKTIGDGVSIRNGMVHGGSPPPSSEKVREIIDVVQELLWICDYYSGYRWAVGNIKAMKQQNI
jgi:hypothetical protein